MKLTTITILANDADADSAQRIYQQGEPDAVWQAFQALMTNPDNVLTFGLAPTAAEPNIAIRILQNEIEQYDAELATLRTQLAEQQKLQNIIFTTVTHSDDCCGCLNVTLQSTTWNLLLTCNECGKEAGRIDIESLISGKLDELRFRLYYYEPFSGTAHTAACSIWREDGQGHAEGFEGDRGPCNCNALENFERLRAESAERQLTIWQEARNLEVQHAEKAEKQLEERNAQVAEMIDALTEIQSYTSGEEQKFDDDTDCVEWVDLHLQTLLANVASGSVQWLADHDAQVLRDAARACRAGKCGDPRCDHITCGTLEVAADRILEVADARADRLSAPKPEQG